ncbi:hypothetical protein [Candidatus Odyssella acanthamoebae]|uniref:Uncharacterized protein n=1 Tax=Candidatus Odyssella acanthamoebae TaxID=91604 RepID=A0A077AR80_9PROT|nr:hypothetical protein [Candidatus Paracaedibacter acanthamoebae]AIK95692.1 hypothetical protein ID47_01465 [Candidatus Paracaedibacter acanthamoebae]
MDQQNLIVPLNVQAYCISGNDASIDGSGIPFVPADADFSLLPYMVNSEQHNIGANLSANILSIPFDTITNLERGVHLHWALPNALIRGSHDTSSRSLNFPSVPNRWLITRLGFDSANTLVNTQSWVVESDFLDTTQNGPCTSVPYQYGTYGTDGNQPFRYMGRVVPLQSWTGENTENSYYDNLTAIGYGNINFSSFYPNCRSVFGFYDDVQDIQQSLTLTYSVVGWYSEDNKDFLNSLGNGENTQDWLASQDWGLSPEAQQQLVLNTSASLYSGFIQNIQWNPNQQSYFDSSPLEASVVCGNTGIEALSAFFMHYTSSPEATPLTSHTEDILNAFQLGMLKELESPEGILKIQQTLHHKRFTQKDGGPLWTIAPITLESNSTSPLQTKTMLPPQWGSQLNQLNEKQLSLNNLRNSIDSLRWQIFSDWSKFMTLKYPPGEVTNTGSWPFAASDVSDYIKSEMSNMGGVLPNIQNSLIQLLEESYHLSAEVKNLADALQAKISNANPNNPIQYILTCDKAFSGRYYSPANPSLLIAGNANETWNYAGNRNKTPDGILDCRISNQVIAAPSSIPISNTNLLYSNDINALVNEAAWLSNSNNLSSSPPSNGTLPSSVAMQSWLPAQWFPLLLQWKIEYFPLKRTNYPVYDSDHIIKNFELDKLGGELAFNGSPEFDTGIYGNYSGTVVLTPSNKETLLCKLQAFLKQHPNPKLEAILTQLNEVPLLSQSLDGYFEQMLMRQKTLQLDIFDPLSGGEKPFNEEVGIAVGGMNITAPLPENIYSPINDGVFQITQLQVVDAFGRIQAIDISTTPVIYPESATIIKVESQDYAHLSTNIVQDSRLSFDFLTAVSQQEEMNTHPAISPICGWVFPNNLDDSLMFYDPLGNPIGSLVAGSEEIVWQSAPGRFPFGTSMEDCFNGVNNSFEGINTVLYNMANVTLNNGLQYFKDLIRAINQSLSYIEPSGYTGTISNAVLCGSPLALVQASIRLELQGLPSPDESYDALQNDMNNSNIIDRTEDGFTQVQFPVQLGDLSDFQDGLIGYFAGSTPNVDYTTFYTTNDKSEEDTKIIAGNKLFLTPYSEYYASSDPTQYVSMLIDPRASINAISGILPVKTIKVPETQYAQALNSIYITFLTAPIITDANNETGSIYIPTPTQGGANWSWLTASNEAWSQDKVVATGGTVFANPQQISEGWLKLQENPAPETQSEEG